MYFDEKESQQHEVNTQVSKVKKEVEKLMMEALEIRTQRIAEEKAAKESSK